MKRKVEAEKAKKLEKKKSINGERTDTYATEEVGDHGIPSSEDAEQNV